MGRDAPDRLSLRALTNRIFLSAGLILAGIGVAVAAGAASVSMLPAALCGAGIACGNFFLIRKILEKAFTGGGAVNKATSAASASVSSLSSAGTRTSASANIPGRSRSFGFFTSTRASTVRVCGSS